MSIYNKFIPGRVQISVSGGAVSSQCRGCPNRKAFEHCWAAVYVVCAWRGLYCFVYLFFYSMISYRSIIHDFRRASRTTEASWLSVDLTRIPHNNLKWLAWPAHIPDVASLASFQHFLSCFQWGWSSLTVSFGICQNGLRAWWKREESIIWC